MEKKSIVKKPLFWIIIAVSIIVIGIGGYILYNSLNTFTGKYPSGSMENTIMENDTVLGKKNAYTFDNPKRGDVIAFKFPDNEVETMVKRIIGLPGETVHIKDSKIYIDDSETPLSETYLKEEWIEDSNYDETFKVPKDSYFCLGDNRNVSNDARFWNKKYVEKEQIKAKINYTIHSNGKKVKIETPNY